MSFHYQEFVSRKAEIVAIGPDSMGSFKKYWADQRIPFVGLPDPDHLVAKSYRQEVNLFRLGRMPLNCVVDMQGRIRYIHYGASMRDIPDNETLLEVIDKINGASI